jgi:hypothetical protein
MSPELEFLRGALVAIVVVLLTLLMFIFVAWVGREVLL